MSGPWDDDEFRSKLHRLGSYLIELASGDQAEGIEHDLPALPLPIRGGVGHNVDDSPRLVELAAREYRERMRRVEFFGEDLFGEPGWDMLLDLFIAKSSGLRVSITSACIAANVPQATALRWITVLEEKSLAQRAGDLLDRRRTWIELTDYGYRLVVQYLRGHGQRPTRHIATHVTATTHPIPR